MQFQTQDTDAKNSVMKIATHLLRQSEASIAMIEAAVGTALRKAQIDPQQDAVSGVLLFLSEDFDTLLSAALQATMRATLCTNIHGTLSCGLLNEHGWVIDSPAVAIMVFSGVHLHGNPADHACGFVLTSHEHRLNTAWMDRGPQLQVGSVSGNTALWHAGRVCKPDDPPLTMVFDPLQLRYFDNTIPPPGRHPTPPQFGLLFPNIDLVLSDHQALDRQLAQLRRHYPGLPLLGLFDPAAAGHVLPLADTADGGVPRHHISPHHNLLILAHHV